jgi:glycosyltransferase involved in cell wall biosynthesis
MVQETNAKQKPKILFVYNTIAPYTRPFFTGLSRIYDVKFIFTDIQVSKDMYKVATPEKGENADNINYRTRRRHLRIISPSGVPLGLFIDLCRERCDAVVAIADTVEMPLCFLAARLRRKPLLLESVVWEWGKKPGIKKPGSFFTRYFLRCAEAVIVPGTKHKEYAVALGARPDKVFIMPYASNIVFKEADYKEARRIRESLNIASKKVIFFVGRLVDQKGVNYLLEVFAMIRKERDDVALLIVGDGEAKAKLEAQAADLGVKDSARFVGFQSNEKLAAYYLAGDICAVPSITLGQADVWVRTVNDAMQAGKPVVATSAVGASFDMIEEGENGFIVPERDGAALYQALKKLVVSPELAKKMGEKSKLIVEQRFEYPQMIDGFSRAIEAVLDGKGRKKKVSP